MFTLTAKAPFFYLQVRFYVRLILKLTLVYCLFLSPSRARRQRKLRLKKFEPDIKFDPLVIYFICGQLFLVGAFIRQKEMGKVIVSAYSFFWASFFLLLCLTKTLNRQGIL